MQCLVTCVPSEKLISVTVWYFKNNLEAKIKAKILPDNAALFEESMKDFPGSNLSYLFIP